MQDDTFEESIRKEKLKIISSIPTAKTVDVYAYNGVKSKTLVDRDSNDLLLLLAKYDSLDSVLQEKEIHNYEKDKVGYQYYKINYDILKTEFSKVHINENKKVNEEKIYNDIYDKIIDEWNDWDLTYCSEDIQIEIANKMIKEKNSENLKYEYITHFNQTEEYQGNFFNVYYYSFQSYKKENGVWKKDEVVTFAPNYDLVCTAKKEYYDEQEKANQQQKAINIYRKTGGSTNERYLLIGQYYKTVPEMNYEDAYFIMQKQILKDGKWIDQNQITINKNELYSFEREGKIYSIKVIEGVVEKDNVRISVKLDDLKQKREQLHDTLNQAEMVEEETHVHHM